MGSSGEKFIGRECLDFWLTCYDRPVTPLQTCSNLEIVYARVTHPGGVPQSLDDLELIQVIGKGGFSTVHAVRSRLDGRLFALKSVRKQKIADD